jgi:septum formation topological specificity factor MinE
MKKSELNKVLVEELSTIMERANVAKAVRNDVIEVVNKYTEPKKGGMTVDLETVVKRDDEGNITHILDASGVAYLPATVENFYEAKNGGIEVAEGLKLKRVSRLGEKIKKASEKAKKASEKAIMQDVLDGVVTPEEGKAKLAEIIVNPDYSELLKIEGAIPAETK